MKYTEIIDVIEKFAPPAWAASWDVSGIQVASTRRNATRMAVCLDPSPASIKKVITAGAHIVVSHHPLLMQPRLPAVLDAYHKVLSLLLQHKVLLYAAHTSLDCNPQGPVSWLAEELQLADRKILEITGHFTPVNAPSYPCGFGMVGNLPRAMDFSDFTAHIAPHIPLDTAILCGVKPHRIRRVGYCAGSGASLIPAAAKHAVDVYITGDIKYHVALEAPVTILDVGHHSLEEEMMRRFALCLQEALPEIQVDFIDSPSPFHTIL